MAKRPKKSLQSVSIGGESFFTIRDLSAKCGIGERALGGYIRSGELSARKICNTWLVAEDAVREFFQSDGVRNETE